MSGHLNIDAHVQISMTVTLDVFDAFPLEPEHRSGLRAGRNFQRGLAVQSGHLDISAQSRLNEAYWYLAQQIIAVALKDFVWFNVEKKKETPRGPPSKPAPPIASRARGGAC